MDWVVAFLGDTRNDNFDYIIAKVRVVREDTQNKTKTMVSDDLLFF